MTLARNFHLRGHLALEFTIAHTVVGTALLGHVGSGLLVVVLAQHAFLKFEYFGRGHWGRIRGYGTFQFAFMDSGVA
jgi:hypothetical protein